MSGLGGLNKSSHGVVMGLVQLQLPVVETPEQLAAPRNLCLLTQKETPARFRPEWARRCHPPS